jgi:hypothetical protein
MEVTKPYKFIGFGGMEVTKPYEFIGFGVFRQYLGVLLRAGYAPGSGMRKTGPPSPFPGSVSGDLPGRPARGRGRGGPRVGLLGKCPGPLGLEISQADRPGGGAEEDPPTWQMSWAQKFARQTGPGVMAPNPIN